MSAILFPQRFGNDIFIEDHRVGVTSQRLGDPLNVIELRHAAGFARLGHQIGNVNDGAFRRAQRGGEILHQQVGDDARKEAARPQNDHIGMAKDRKRLAHRLHARRFEADAANVAAAFRHRQLAAQSRSVVRLRDERDVFRRDRQHPAADRQQIVDEFHGVFEIARLLRRRQQDQIAETVSFQIALAETEVHEGPQLIVVFAEGNQTVADVAGRQHAPVAHQAPGTAAFIGHRDQGDDVARITLQSLQKRRKPRPAADCHKMGPSRETELYGSSRRFPFVCSFRYETSHTAAVAEQQRHGHAAGQTAADKNQRHSEQKRHDSRPPRSSRSRSRCLMRQSTPSIRPSRSPSHSAAKTER